MNGGSGERREKRETRVKSVEDKQKKVIVIQEEMLQGEDMYIFVGIGDLRTEQHTVMTMRGDSD